MQDKMKKLVNQVTIQSISYAFLVIFWLKIIMESNFAPDVNPSQLFLINLQTLLWGYLM